MSKDDYQVLVYKILLYYYACLKRKITFDQKTFYYSISKDINENYLADIFDMMSEEGYLSGVVITKAWGNILRQHRTTTAFGFVRILLAYFPSYCTKTP